MWATLRKKGSPVTIVRYSSERKAVEQVTVNASNPTPSNDGQKLAYLHPEVRPQVSPRMALMISDVDGQEAKPVVIESYPDGDISAPQWSPDSRWLVFTVRAGTHSEPQQSFVERVLGIDIAQAHEDRAELWIANAEGQEARRIESKDIALPHAAWSPDGLQLAYTSDLGLFILDVATGRELKITQQTGHDDDITWASR